MTILQTVVIVTICKNVQIAKHNFQVYKISLSLMLKGKIYKNLLLN